MFFKYFILGHADETFAQYIHWIVEGTLKEELSTCNCFLFTANCMWWFTKIYSSFISIVNIYSCLKHGVGISHLMYRIDHSVEESHSRKCSNGVTKTRISQQTAVIKRLAKRRWTQGGTVRCSWRKLNFVFNTERTFSPVLPMK